MGRYDDFEGSGAVILQPGSQNNSYRFKFETPDTEEGRGSLPYDTQISSVSVSGFAEDGTDVSALMVGSVNTFPGNIVVVKLNHTGTTTGRHKLKFILTLNDSSLWEKDFNRLELIDL